jgi:hypothetical protein
MEMGMAPELMYVQNVYAPTNGNPYTYGYAEVGSPMDWYNNQNSLGYDGQEVYYPVSAMSYFLRQLFLFKVSAF